MAVAAGECFCHNDDRVAVALIAIGVIFWIFEMVIARKLRQ